MAMSGASASIGRILILTLQCCLIKQLLSTFYYCNHWRRHSCCNDFRDNAFSGATLHYIIV
jgi:hypothetical protein